MTTTSGTHLLTEQEPVRDVPGLEQPDLDHPLRDSKHAFQVQQQFAEDLLAAMPSKVRQRMSGLMPAT